MSVEPPPRTRDEAPRAARVTYAGGTVTVVVQGAALGATEAPAIAAEVIALLQARGRQVRALVFDLGRVSFMSSSGLGLVIDLRNRAHALGARTFAIGLHPDVREIFRMMKTDRLVEIVEDR